MYVQRGLGDNLDCVELFCGIGGFRIAADRLGMQTVLANDFDASAGKVYCENFGSSQFCLGDINDLVSSVPRHDVLTAGFPCQPFSAAGKKLGIEDTRGTLFGTIAQILRNHKPQVFVLENVKRILRMDKGSHFRTILYSLTSAGYCVEWRLANTNWFELPQNRPRVVIVGTRVPRYHGGSIAPLLIDSTHVRSLQNYSSFSLDSKSVSFGSWGICNSESGITSESCQGDMSKTQRCIADIMDKDVEGRYDLTDRTISWVGTNITRDKLVDGVHIVSNQKGGARMGYTIFGTSGYAPTLTCTTSRHYERYQVGEKYRRLKPTEYARLQGFPDDHCNSVPHDKRYVLFGNSISPLMAEWAMRSAISNPVPVSLSQSDLFT